MLFILMPPSKFGRLLSSEKNCPTWAEGKKTATATATAAAAAAAATTTTTQKQTIGKNTVDLIIIAKNSIYSILFKVNKRITSQMVMVKFVKQIKRLLVLNNLFKKSLINKLHVLLII